MKIKRTISQFKEIIPLHIKANDFIRSNKLLKGLFKMKWVFWLAVLFSIIISIHFISVFIQLIQSTFTEQENTSVIFAGTQILSSVHVFGNELFLSGGIKYLILIFAEVIIFHCTVTTINILSGKAQKPNFRDFLHAEKRMIVVSLTAWALEIILSLIIRILFSIVGLSIISRAIEYIIEFYFVGHLFLDNYNQQFGLTVKESFNNIRSHAGAAIGIGLIAYCLFLIPVIGIIAAPILGAVTGAMYMYSHKVHMDKKRIYEFV